MAIDFPSSVHGTTINHPALFARTYIKYSKLESHYVY